MSGQGPVAPRSADAWAALCAQARELSERERRHHAAISLQNNCSCVACFGCACQAVEESILANEARRRRMRR